MSALALPAHRTALLGVVLYLALGCGPSAGEGEVSEGQALYEAHCMTCHGETARGDGPLASTLPVQPPSILEHLGHHTQAQLVQLIRTGIPPAMPPAALTDEQIQVVVDYAWTLVPEDEVAALRAVQEQAEAMGGMPGMSTVTDPGGSARVTPPADAQEFAFAGTVQGVDAAAGTLAVQNDDIPGWMSSMTMSYAVDSAAVLDRLEAGDRITATVYAGDFRMLYGVQVEP
ncbi:MAG TPA: c-type cytochrome [Longimicrobiales bacterium]|nr:c-type cytochrome [Longimicrobiales bacterium]